MAQGSTPAGSGTAAGRARPPFARNRRWRWIAVLAILAISLPLFVLAVRTQPPSPAAPLAMSMIAAPPDQPPQDP